MTSVTPDILPAPPRYGLRIALFYAGYFTVAGVSLPFFPIWLKARGLTPDEIAVCIAAPLFLRVLLTPLGGWLADRAPNRRFAIRIYTGLAFVIFLFADLAEGFVPILVVTTAAFLFWQIALPAGEALALTGVRRYGLDFGRMRLAGSIAFIAANLGSGALLGWFAPASVFWALAGVLLLAAVFSLTLPVTPRAVRALDDSTRPAPAKAGGLLRDRVFLALMAAGALLQASHALLYGFGSIYWTSLGFSGTEIGVLWATGVIAEIVLFSVSGAAARRFGAIGLMAIGGAAAMLRWLLFPIGGEFGFYLVLQALHGLTFGASFLGAQMAILRHAPEEVTGSAQSIASMLGGLAMAVATALSGPLYGGFGIYGVIAMLVPTAVALAILALCRSSEPVRATAGAAPAGRKG